MDIIGYMKRGSLIERIEKLSIAVLMLGVLIFMLGVAFSIASPSGLSAVMAMSGSFITFVFTILLVAVWLLKRD